MIKEVQRNATLTESIDFVQEHCCTCGIPFFIPTYHKKRLLNSQEWFYCPNGHQQHYTGKTEAQKLKEQLEATQQQAAKERQELEDKWLEEAGKRAKLERQMKRVHKGVCPCCNRSFVNLQRHMKAKHPEVNSPTYQI